jgi:hypothetical protein
MNHRNAIRGLFDIVERDSHRLPAVVRARAAANGRGDWDEVGL